MFHSANGCLQPVPFRRAEGNLFRHGIFSVRGVGLKLGCGHHGLYVGLHLADGLDIKIFDQYLDHGR